MYIEEIRLRSRDLVTQMLMVRYTIQNSPSEYYSYYSCICTNKKLTFSENKNAFKYSVFFIIRRLIQLNNL